VLVRLFLYLLVTLAAFGFASRESQAKTVSPALERVLQSLGPGEDVSVIISFSEKVKLDDFSQGDRKDRRSGMIRALKQNADRSHVPLRAFLRSKGKAKSIHELWLINGLAVTLPAVIVPQLLNWSGVENVKLDGTISAPAVTQANAGETEWNIQALLAPELWNLGYTGQNVVIASMDTGVDHDHPDLAGKWRGGNNSWYDPNGQHPAAPYDSNGHGTAVMGIMVGGSAGGTAIGVAPGAKWIAVKIFNDADVAAESKIHLGFQWLLDPDGNPDTDDAPDIVNNSWGFDDRFGQCVEGAGGISFRDDIQALKAAGIAVVFSAGNSGDLGSNTSVSPANYPESFSVGAVDETNSIASFSGQGPSACDGAVYPKVVAPGSRSSFPFGIKTSDRTGYPGEPAYQYVTAGTSWAAPHASGAMALLISAFPSISVEELESALKLSALDSGDRGPDNQYGYGVADALKAYEVLDKEILVTRSSHDADNHRLFVSAVAYGHAPGSLTLTVTAHFDGTPVLLGTLKFGSSSGEYRKVFQGVATRPELITVSSTSGALDTVPVGYTYVSHADSVVITQVLHDPGRNMLFVAAVTDAAIGSVNLSIPGYGRLPYRAARGEYRAWFKGVADFKKYVVVKSTGGGWAVASVPFADLPNPDTVTIARTKYVAEDQRLHVVATSDVAVPQSVTLYANAHFGENEVPLGVVPYSAAKGDYRRWFYGVPSQPDFVSVTSNGGGSDDASVPFP
jgi:subtilisin family serine protease